MEGRGYKAGRECKEDPKSQGGFATFVWTKPPLPICRLRYHTMYYCVVIFIPAPAYSTLTSHQQVIAPLLLLSVTVPCVSAL